MKRQEVFKWCKQQYGTEPDYPWNDGNRVVDVLNVKCDPILIGSLQTQPDFFPAYHMNKDKWNSIILDGTVSADEIINLIDLSYQLTKK